MQIKEKIINRKLLYEKIAEEFPHDILLKKYEHITRLKKVIYFIKKLGSNFLILDAGCGGGVQLSEVIKFNSAIGIDISKKRLIEAKHRVKNAILVNGDIYFLPFKNQIFDISLMLEVIEHLYYPRAALKEIYRVLKSNGYLILTLPCRTNILDIILSDKKWGLLEDMSHIQFYTISSIKKILSKENFKIINHIGGPCLRWNINVLNKTIFRKKRVYKIMDKIASIIPIIKKYGAIETILAQKINENN